ncbi:hypothetical protein XPA_001301 [Xanthoria parietina]
MTCETDKKIILEERTELDFNGPSFGEECPTLLHMVGEVCSDGRMLDDYGLTYQRAILGTSNPENIREIVNVSQGHVILGRCQGSAETGAVEKKKQVELFADCGDRCQLAPVVQLQRANLGCVGDEKHLGLRLEIEC